MSLVRQHGPNRHFNHLVKYGARAASHITNRAIDHVFQNGNKILVEKIQKYMHGQTNGRKYLSHKAAGHHHAKHHHKEKPIINSVELEASGVEHETYTFKNKPNKKAKLLKSLSRPVVHRDTTGITLNGGTGQCNYVELSNNQRGPMTFRLNEALTQATLTSPLTSNKNTQVLYKSLKLKRTVTNSHNEPCYIMWHEFLAKTAQTASPITIANTQSTQEGAANSGGGGIFFPDTDLRMYSDLRKNFKLLHRRRVYLKPGETVVFYTNYIFNKFLTYQFINTDMTTPYMAGIVPSTVFQVQGASATDVTAGGAVTLCRIKVDIVEIQTMEFEPFPYPLVKLSRFDSANSLPLVLVGATTHANVDTGVIEIDADA